MQIKSIKKIKQIGTFSNFLTGGSKRFEPFTILYGLNASGKTTLCDIFRSLATQSNDILVNRKTIPESFSNQHVELSLKENEEENENSVNFRNNSWDFDVNGKMQIFDSEFIHRNVFTGTSIERNNKENFTDFIIGEKDVEKAEELITINQDLRANNLKKFIPNFVKDKNDFEIKRFIDLRVEENLEDLLEQRKEVNTAVVNEEKNLSEKDIILAMPNLPEYQEMNSKTYIDYIQEYNKVLSSDFNSIDSVTIDQFNEHIKNHFNDKNLSERWIRDGLKIGKIDETDTCPFCGQNTIEVDLLRIYQAYFSDAYKSFIESNNNKLDSLISCIVNYRFTYNNFLSNMLIVLSNYEKIIFKEDFSKEIALLKQIYSSIINLKEDFIKESGKLKDKLESSRFKKKNKPYEKVEVIEFSTIQEIIFRISDYQEEISKKYSFFSHEIDKLKRQYSSNEKEEYVKSLKLKIKDIDYKIKRIEQDSECSRYQEIGQKILQWKQRKILLNQEIEASQSEFIEQFFESVNDYFQQLGSRNFDLVKNVDNRGNKKVYSLDIKFKNKKIPKNKISIIFSESDRRALALSIFLSKLNSISERLNDMIVIFDDPVTSFDQNRVTKTVNIFKLLKNKTSQVIVLTHYLHFIERFSEICKRDSMQYKILRIVLNSASSEIEEIDLNNFLQDNHKKMLLHILKFINREHTDEIKPHLRIFTENHVQKIFAKQIYERNINFSNFNELINNLCSNEIINESIRDKLHIFRETLNPDNHIYTVNNDEDCREFATELIDFLYSNKLS